MIQAFLIVIAAPFSPQLAPFPPKLIEVPAGFHHNPRQVASNEASFLTLHFEDGAAIILALAQHAADASDLFQLMLHDPGFKIPVTAGNLDQNGFGAPSPRLQVAYRVGRNKPPLVGDY